MKDYKNSKEPERLTKDDIFAGVFFVAVVLGGWLILNLI
jgi:hypothetical protein